MRFFIDAEFWERGPDYPIRLISLGIVADNCEDLYVVNSDFNWTHCDDEWLRKNVMLNVLKREAIYCPHLGIHKIVEKWVKQQCGGSDPVFWGYYAAYDWVLFSQLWGKMIEMPESYPKHVLDLKQYAGSVGNPKLPPKLAFEHNAVQDASWIREAFYAVVDHATKDTFPRTW